MTEDKWLAAANPLHLLLHVKRTAPGLRTKHGRRKFRLFACGCARRVLSERSAVIRPAIEAAERFADGELDATELYAVSTTIFRDPVWKSSPRSLRRVVLCLIDPETWRSVQTWRWATNPDMDALRGNKPTEEKRHLAELVRDLFGNPYRPVKFDRSWRTSTAVGLADGIYADRAFDRLPILADALEEAGCDNADMLAHCRGDGPHARGCWVVDLVLGKA
jgi:hypothetical protein